MTGAPAQGAATGAYQTYAAYQAPGGKLSKYISTIFINDLKKLQVIMALKHPDRLRKVSRLKDNMVFQTMVMVGGHHLEDKKIKVFYRV